MAVVVQNIARAEAEAIRGLAGGSESIVVLQCENNTGTVICSRMSRVVPPTNISRRREWP